MPDPLLINVTTHESEGTYWAVLQRWVKQACINAGISIPMSDPLLRDLTTYDSEGTRFAVLQRWLALLANNISGGGGGGDVTLAGNNAFTGQNSFANTTTFNAPVDFNDDVTADEIDAQVVNIGSIALNATPVSDDTYNGLAIVGKNAGATIAQWEAVYLGAGFVWLLADANGSGAYPASGLAVAAYGNGNPATILKSGIVRNDAWNWSPGGIYLDTTAGGLTQTPPDSPGDQVQYVGFAMSADVAFFDFNSTYVTVA